MSKLRHAVKDIHTIDDAAGRYGGKGGVHPLSRVLVTVSFPKYHVIGLAGMVLYPLILGIWEEISVSAMVYRLWPVFLVTVIVSLANPILDREVYAVVGQVTVTGGMLSMATLILKGIFCVAASYILVETTGMEKIGYVLKLLHVPKEIVTMFMLMHRYLMVLLKEVERMQQAYQLRAPGHRGLQPSAWGSFAGLLLLRSIDRAGEVQESMELRGYTGEMQYATPEYSRGESILYLLLWGMAILLLRIFPVFQIVGGLL
jgi:cobalt/nickel transport system permease protein